jgi:NTE family protein
MLLSACPSAADETDPGTESGRPRIGLVLGGGGARGAAHIGVLRELERQRIPIDAIAGTSIGAVVGGLYASGRTPAELETLVGSIDWADAFIDTPPREDLVYRRKQDDAAYPAKLELGVRDGSLRIPKGLIQGQKLQLILQEQLLHVSGVSDFDRLPTPFRAVASDIATGEPYVMSSGDLALAVRASMSAPGIFSPVEVDGHALVDGGLVGNVPVDVIRDMDVDVIIAVDVEFPLYPPDQLHSALEITGQMLTILIRKETRRQLAGLGDDDILIRPDLGAHGSTDFDNIEDVIEPGRVATAALADRLAALSVPEADYRAFMARRKLADGRNATIDFVRVADQGPLSASVLQDRLRIAPGDPVDPARLAEDIRRLYGLNYYENVGYRFVTEEERSGIEFYTRAKSWGPNFLKFGLSLEDDFEGSTAFNIAARLTATGLNARGAEWRNDLQLGTSPQFESEFYQPLRSDARYFVAPRARLEQRNFRAFAGASTVARYRVSEAELGVDLGRSLGNWGEIRAGIHRGVGDARVKVGDPVLPNAQFDSGGALAQLNIDTLDDAQFPNHGTLASADWLLSRTGLGADGEFDTVALALDQYWSWGPGDRNTLQFGLEYATTINSRRAVQDFFTLGGFLRMSGLGRGELGGPHIGLGRLVYYRRVGETGGGVFDMPLYLGGSIETGNAWQNRSDISLDSTIVNGSVFAALDTFFGRLYIAAGFSEHGESNFYLSLGNPGL